MKPIKDLLTRGGRLSSTPQIFTLEEAANLLITAHVGTFVVCDEEQIMRTLSRNDIARCCARKPKQITTLTISKVMTKKLLHRHYRY